MADGGKVAGKLLGPRLRNTSLEILMEMGLAKE
jgi:hypothetical protein